MVVVGLVVVFTSAGVLKAKKVDPTVELFSRVGSGRYVILFQNDAELRSTGGFIGSFAVAEVSNYRLKNIDFETNIYKRDETIGSLGYVTAPGPLQEYGSWKMRDSNWAADYSEAAQNFLWFYQKIDAVPIDGVIGINTQLISDLLKLTGPIELAQYQLTLTADNVRDVIQTEVERNYFTREDNTQINEPKTILKDAFPVILSKLNKTPRARLAGEIFWHLKTKDILLYFRDAATQNLASALNWAGRVAETKNDYLYLVDSNISGSKSSPKIGAEVEYKLQEENGKLVANLTLRRTHSGSYLWPDGDNRSYLRVLVQTGSELISYSADGVEQKDSVDIGSEAGKTVFGFWQKMAPRTSRIVTLSFRLPDNLTRKNYHLYFQRQSGSPPLSYRVNLFSKVFEGRQTTDLEFAR